MTQVAQIFEEEKRQALEQAAQTYEKEKYQIVEEERRQIIIKMIKKNYPVDEISTLISNYSQEDIELLRRELEEN